MTNQRNSRQTYHVNRSSHPSAELRSLLVDAAWRFGLSLREANAPTQPTPLTLSVSST
jgi:hypothetical protein